MPPDDSKHQSDRIDELVDSLEEQDISIGDEDTDSPHSDDHAHEQSSDDSDLQVADTSTVDNTTTNGGQQGESSNSNDSNNKIINTIDLDPDYTSDDTTNSSSSISSDGPQRSSTDYLTPARTFQSDVDTATSSSSIIIKTAEGVLSTTGIISQILSGIIVFVSVGGLTIVGIGLEYLAYLMSLSVMIEFFGIIIAPGFMTEAFSTAPLAPFTTRPELIMAALLYTVLPTVGTYLAGNLLKRVAAQFSAMIQQIDFRDQQ